MQRPPQISEEVPQTGKYQKPQPYIYQVYGWTRSVRRRVPSTLDIDRTPLLRIENADEGEEDEKNPDRNIRRRIGF